MSTATTKRAFKPTSLWSGRRGLVFITIFFVNFVVWLESAKFGLLNPFWSADLGLNADQIAKASASYLLGYFPLLLFAGVLSDRFGAKRMLLICVAGVTVLSAMMSFVETYGEMYWRNLVFGIFFGFLWAPSQRLVSAWFPGTMGPKATAVWMSSTLTPGLLAPLIAYPIATAWDWRVAFFVIAALGVPALLALIFLVSDTPQKDKRISDAERDAILADFKEAPKARVPLKLIMREFKRPTIIFMSIATAFGTSATWLMGTWLPQGLITYEGLDPNFVGYMTPLFAIIPIGVGFLHGALVEKFFGSRLKPWLIIGPLCGAVGYAFSAAFPGSPWFLWGLMVAGIAYLSDPFFWGTVNSYWAAIARPEATGTLNGLSACLQVAVGWFVLNQSGQWVNEAADDRSALSPIWWVGAAMFAFTIIPVLLAKDVRLNKVSKEQREAAGAVPSGRH